MLALRLLKSRLASSFAVDLLRQPEPWRFCLWGHRRGYIQVGSIEDARWQAEQERVLRFMRRMRAAMEEMTVQFERLKQAAVPCSEAAERLVNSFRALAPRRHGTIADLKRALAEGALRL